MSDNAAKFLGLLLLGASLFHGCSIMDAGSSIKEELVRTAENFDRIYQRGQLMCH